MDNVDFLPLQTGGSMQLTMIFIKFAIRSTDGHVAGLAIFYASALGLIGLLVHDTLAPPTAVLLLTRCMEAILPIEHWEEQKTSV